MNSDLAYPIGRLKFRDGLSMADRAALIDEIEATPAALRRAVAGLTDAQLDTPYRPDGWTVRQVAHHLPDSHMNAFCRFRLALTEPGPTIRPYNEAEWAKLADARMPVDPSLRLLDALHERCVYMLRTLREPDYARPLHHPESGPMTIDHLLQIYAWHGRHHVAHITSLRERMGW